MGSFPDTYNDPNFFPNEAKYYITNFLIFQFSSSHVKILETIFRRSIGLKQTDRTC